MAMTLTADEVQPLERHAEWRAAGCRSRGLDPSPHHGRDHRTRSGVSPRRSHADDVLDVTKALFPPDALCRCAAEIAEQLINDGFQRISACPSIGSVLTTHRGSTGASACISACRGHRTPRAICSVM